MSQPGNRKLGIITVSWANNTCIPDYQEVLHGSDLLLQVRNALAVVEGILCKEEDQCEWCTMLRRRMQSRWLHPLETSSGLSTIREAIMARIVKEEAFVDITSPAASSVMGRGRIEALRWVLEQLGAEQPTVTPVKYTRKLRIPE